MYLSIYLFVCLSVFLDLCIDYIFNTNNPKKENPLLYCLLKLQHKNTNVKSVELTPAM